MTFVRGHFQQTETGYAYIRPNVRHRGSDTESLLVLGLMASVVTVAFVRFFITHWLLGTGAVLATGVVVVVAVATNKFGSGAVERYLELAREVARGAEGAQEEFKRLGQRLAKHNQLRLIGEEEIYGTMIAEILADGEISDEECVRLEKIHAAFAFDPGRALQIREAAFNGFVSWVGVDLSEEQELGLRTVAERLGISQAHSDHWLGAVTGRRMERERAAERERQAALEAERARQAALEAERERQAMLEAERAREAALVAERERQAALEAERERRASLEAERERRAALAAERAREAELAAERARQAALAAERARQAALEAEQARQAALEAERARKAELAAEQTRRMRAQRDAAQAIFDSERREPMNVDMKLKRGETCWMSAAASLRDRKVTLTGTCFVTNKRILFVGDKAVSINLTQVLDAAADPQTGVLRVIKDGRKTPYEFTLDEPLVVLAHVERSLTEAGGA